MKGYIRTLEAFLAAALTFFAVMTIFPTIPSAEREPTPVIRGLLYDSVARGCVLEGNISCLNATISPLVPSSRYFLLDLTDDPAHPPSGLPSVRVDSETIFFAGNDTHYSPKILRLYSWVK